MALFTGILKNSSMCPFTTNKVSGPSINFSQFLLKWVSLPANYKIFFVHKFFTKGWTRVKDSTGIHSENLLGKGTIFWSRYLLMWDTTVPIPETPLTHSISIVYSKMTVLKWPSIIRFVVARWSAFPKGIFIRRKNATISIEKASNVRFLEPSV